MHAGSSVENRLEGASMDRDGPVRRLLWYPRKMQMVPWTRVMLVEMVVNLREIYKRTSTRLSDGLDMGFEDDCQLSLTCVTALMKESVSEKQNTWKGPHMNRTVPRKNAEILIWTCWVWEPFESPFNSIVSQIFCIQSPNSTSSPSCLNSGLCNYILDN